MSHPEQKNYQTPNKKYNCYTSNKENYFRDWVCLNCNNLNYSFRKKCNLCKNMSRDCNFITPTNYYYYYGDNNYSINSMKENKNIQQQPQVSHFQISFQNSYLEVLEKENKNQTTRTREKDKFKNSRSNQEKLSLLISGQKVVSQFASSEEISDRKVSLRQFKTPLKIIDQDFKKNSKVSEFQSHQLPSVSPLLKKYKQSKGKKQNKDINHRSNTEKLQNRHILPSQQNNKLFVYEYTSLNNDQFDYQKQLQWSNLIVRDFNEQLNEKSRPEQSQANCSKEIEKLISSIILQNQ